MPTFRNFELLYDYKAAHESHIAVMIIVSPSSWSTLRALRLSSLDETTYMLTSTGSRDCFGSLCGPKIVHSRLIEFCFHHSYRVAYGRDVWRVLVLRTQAKRVIR